MNINSDFNNEEVAPPANQVMETGMDYIYETLIEPMQDKLDQEDLKIISLIGMSFKIIAEQATALEQLERSIEGDFTDNDISRN